MKIRKIQFSVLALCLLVLFSCRKEDILKPEKIQPVPDKDNTEEIIIADNVRVMEGDYDLLSSEEEIANGIFIFKPTDIKNKTSANKTAKPVNATDVKKGDVLVGGDNGGYLKRVTDVRKRPDGTVEVITDETATMEDVFVQAKMKKGFKWSDINPFNGFFDNSKAEAEKGVSVSGTTRAVEWNMKGVRLEFADNFTAKIPNGKFTLDSEYELGMEFKNSKLSKLNFQHKFIGEQEIDFDLWVNLPSLYGPTQFERTIFKFPSATVRIMVGWVPLAFVLQTELKFKVDYQGAPVVLSGHFEHKDVATTTVNYSSGKITADWKYNTEKFKFSNWKFERGRTRVRVKVYPEVLANMYGLGGGPFAQVAGVWENIGDANYSTGDWSMFSRLRMDMEAGLKTKSIGRFREPKLFQRKEFDPFWSYELPYKMDINYNTSSKLAYENVNVKIMDNSGKVLAQQLDKSSSTGTFLLDFNSPVYFNDKRVVTSANGVASYNWKTSEPLTITIKHSNGDIIRQQVLPAITGSNINTNNGTTIYTGKVWNIKGYNPGAWDLITNQDKTIYENDMEKDLINTTTTFGTFNKELKAVNDTRFVKTSSSFTSIKSFNDAQSIYNKTSSKVSTLSKISKGYRYVAKLRNGDKYAVISITNVVETPSDNLDYITFEYKIY